MSDIQRIKSQKLNENNSVSPFIYKEKNDDKMDGLIIDDNTVYEIDEECYERVKRSRINQKKGWDKR